MGGMFSQPSTPKIETTILQEQTPEIIDESKVRKNTMEALRKKRGRASQLLAGDYYNPQNQTTGIAGQSQASKTLLGQ